MSNLMNQIQAAYDRDQNDPDRPAVEADDIPLHYENITERWLTNVLCADTPGAEVVGHSLDVPDNGSSNRRKISVKYNEAGEAAGLPTKLFAKASHDLSQRLVLGLAGAAEAEVNFYRNIRDRIDIEAPVSHHSALDRESFNSIILLGDISETVTEFCSHKTVMTKERAQSQLRALATLHGTYWGKAEDASGDLVGYATWPGYFDRVLAFGMREGSEAGFQDAEGIIPDRLFQRADEIWPKTLRSVALHDQSPKTLVHGDVHLKNWYVAGDGEMGLSDWQCAHRGSWARDVGYAMATALTVEDRREWEHDLLAYYLDQLQASGGPLIKFDDAFRQIGQQLITALTWWTITLHPAEGMADMQPRDITEEFVRRISIAMDDHETLDKL